MWLALSAALLLLPRRRPAADRVRALAARDVSVAAHPPTRHPGSGSRWHGTVVQSMRRCGESPSRAATVAGLVAVAVVGPVAGLVLAAAAGLITAACAGLATGGYVDRVRDRQTESLATAFAVIAAELEAGSRPAAALDAAAPLCGPFEQTLAAAAQAARLGLEASGPLLAAPPFRPLGCAWRLAEACGAAPAVVVERVAADARARVDMRREVVSAVAGARSSAGLLAVLPLLGLALGSAMDARPLHILLATGAGRVLCLAGVLLDVLGLLWTRRLAACPVGS